MRGFKVLVTAGICGVAMTATAHAADPAETWVPEIKKEIYTDLISGWYVRGDLGYRKQTIGTFEAADPGVATSWNLNSATTFGFGGGYKYKWFRADMTFDYANTARFQGDTATTIGFYDAKIDSYTLLANVYLDLGTWAGFTPYIGAGVGGSNIRVQQYTNALILEPRDGVQNTTRWNLSWAYMGGVSYRFSPNLVLDVSYRYLNLGEAASGTEPPPYTDRSYFRDMSAKEVRVGLRWMLD